MHGQLLQWVCQHYERQPGGLENLLQKIKEIYCDQRTPTLVKEMAKWHVPALFYTFFDGLLEGCANHGKSGFTDIVYTLDEQRAADSEYADKDSLLILVRGSVANDQSLVLTESDHQRLTEDIVNMRKEYEAIAKQVGRCVLFMGVSPRDPLVRQLSYKLLESGRRRQGQPFLSPKITPKWTTPTGGSSTSSGSTRTSKMSSPRFSKPPDEHPRTRLEISCSADDESVWARS